VRINLIKFGSVSNSNTRFILDTIYETFDRLQPHNRELVDVLLFERSSSLSAYLQQEFQHFRVVSDRFEDDFIALHDAWKGIPRISISIEKFNQLPQQVVIGALRHEVGHAILHGEIGYYLLSSSDIFEKLNISKEYVANLLYLISIAVKDYEVTKLLFSRDFEKDQRAYIDYLLTPSDEDATTWLLAKRQKHAQILFVVSCFKQLCSAVALNQELIKIQSLYPFLPKNLIVKMNKILCEISKFPIGKTMENIERLAQLIKEELI